MLLAALVAYQRIGASWINFAALFLAPDISMLAYAFGPKIGAGVYNLLHTYVSPVLLALIGSTAHCPTAISVGLIWIAHIGFDRLLGYGLKYAVGFKATHFDRV